MPEKQTDLKGALLSTLQKEKLIAAGEKVLAGISGGPDSTAMLHALAGMRESLGFTLQAAHLHHGLRGADADADAHYAENLCRSLSVPFLLERADVKGVKKRLHLGTQEAAREVRHAFLNRAAAECGAQKIALAHNRNDRVETILLNMLRGSGAEGLSGFPIQAGKIIRPFYYISREMIERYCETEGLSPRQDASNNSLDYRRNRVREELLPELRTYYNENVDKALLRMSELIRADNTFMEQMALEKFKILFQCGIPDVLTIQREDILAEPEGLRRRLIRIAIHVLRGSLENVGFDAAESVLASLAEGRRSAVTLPALNGLSITLETRPESLQIRIIKPLSEPIAWEKPLLFPGITELPSASLSIEAYRMNSPYDTGRVETSDASRFVALLRLSEITFPLKARGRAPGDRMELKQGRRKLKDLFNEAKVSYEKRAQAAVIVDGSESILMVPGLAVCRSHIISSTLKDFSEPLLLLRASALHTAKRSGVL